jgi:hypothetical protein
MIQITNPLPAGDLPKGDKQYDLEERCFQFAKKANVNSWFYFREIKIVWRIGIWNLEFV